MIVAAAKIDQLGKKMGMWFFLFTEIIFFGGMFILYAIYRYRYALDFHTAAAGENLVLGSLNTVILLTSSYTIALAIAAVKREETLLSTRLQLATVAMGAAFLVIKYLEWHGKIELGYYPNAPLLLKLNRGEILFFGLYFVMTGLHGLHVLIGCIVITCTASLTHRKIISKNSFSFLENTGLYWHFVDIIWIYLFPLFYLIT
jgi:cytochrome c oxidase subunit III